MIINGGECEIGIESTVIDLTSVPRILRPGFITKDFIELSSSKLSSNFAIKFKFSEVSAFTGAQFIVRLITPAP